MWKRPLCTSTSRPASVPATSSPLCPITVGAGKCGMSVYGIAHGVARAARRTGRAPSRARWRRSGRRPSSRARTAAAASSTIADCAAGALGTAVTAGSPRSWPRGSWPACPASMARRPRRARSRFRSGASAPMPPSWMPTELKLAKPGQGERRDRERARVELPLHRPELGEGDELVEHHARAEQAADRAAVVPGHAHRPGDRPEDPAEHASAGWAGTTRRSDGPRRSRR